MERCNKCKRRLRRPELEIGSGYCDACGHAVMAAAAARAQRVGNVRLEREQLERANTAHERFASLTTPLFN